MVRREGGKSADLMDGWMDGSRVQEAKRSSILRAALAQLQGTHYHRQVTKLEESFRAAMEWGQSVSHTTSTTGRTSHRLLSACLPTLIWSGDEASTEQIQKELYSARRRLAAHEAYFRGCLEALREVDHLQRRKYEAERQNNFVQARILHRYVPNQTNRRSNLTDGRQADPAAVPVLCPSFGLLTAVTWRSACGCCMIGSAHTQGRRCC